MALPQRIGALGSIRGLSRSRTPSAPSASSRATGNPDQPRPGGRHAPVDLDRCVRRRDCRQFRRSRIAVLATPDAHVGTWGVTPTCGLTRASTALAGLITKLHLRRSGGCVWGPPRRLAHVSGISCTLSTSDAEGATLPVPVRQFSLAGGCGRNVVLRSTLAISHGAVRQPPIGLVHESKHHRGLRERCAA